MNQHSSLPAKRKNLSATILWAGFVVGLLDIVAAMLLYYTTSQKNPLNILPFIASGVFGRSAFSGETAMIVWGFVFHFLIAYAFTILFFMIYHRIEFLSRSKVLTAVLYGLFIWIVMNLVVLPQTKVPQMPFDITSAIKGIIVLILAIGLPLSYIANRYYFSKRRSLTQ